jgi:hypothetical protein
MCAHSRDPDIVNDHDFGYEWVKRLGYNCRGRYACRTDYQINTEKDTLFGFATYSKQFRDPSRNSGR